MVATANTPAWARLEALMAAMHPGDLVTVEEVVCETGIGAVSAQHMLDVLARAELFEQHGTDFIRVQRTRTHDELTADSAHSGSVLG